jgi:methylenetetrahydrofolate dehydrogenase (NADP+) / methenyltetrahydrofolate cyclohydrolase
MEPVVPQENPNLIILDGRKLADDLLSELKHQINEFQDEAGRVPGLAMIVLGDDRVALEYAHNASQEAITLGIEYKPYLWPSDTDDRKLALLLNDLNNNPLFDGISIQAPLPPHISYEEMSDLIDPRKDVEGYHPLNVGRLFSNMDTMVPPPAVAGIELLLRYGINPAGMQAVVVGRSRVIGKPMSALLSIADATVTICHSATRNLAAYLREADLVVACAGIPGLITGDMLKPGAVVLDYGKTFEGGELEGDIDWESVSKVASAISPVTGGVGPLTTLALMANTIRAAQLSLFSN